MKQLLTLCIILIFGPATAKIDNHGCAFHEGGDCFVQHGCFHTGDCAIETHGCHIEDCSISPDGL